MRNIAQVSVRELFAHRDIVIGVTASVPKYKVMDIAGNKEWVVDVYLGPRAGDEASIARDVPIVQMAKELVGDIRLPVQLYRSQQGKYTVVGRAKILPAGTQTPEGSIVDPSFQHVEYNLAELGLSFIADLDYILETFGGDGVLLQGGGALAEFTWDIQGPIDVALNPTLPVYPVQDDNTFTFLFGTLVQAPSTQSVKVQIERQAGGVGSWIAGPIIEIMPGAFFGQLNGSLSLFAGDLVRLQVLQAGIGSPGGTGSFTMIAQSAAPANGPLQTIRAYDAFGLQVLGPEVAQEQTVYKLESIKTTTTKHVQIFMAKFGPKGDPDAMQWGTGEFQPAIQKVIEVTT